MPIYLIVTCLFVKQTLLSHFPLHAFPSLIAHYRTNDVLCIGRCDPLPWEGVNVIKLSHLSNLYDKKCCLATCRAPLTHPD
jgi:hypothetical protein